MLAKLYVETKNDYLIKVIQKNLVSYTLFNIM